MVVAVQHGDTRLNDMQIIIVMFVPVHVLEAALVPVIHKPKAISAIAETDETKCA